MLKGYGLFYKPPIKPTLTPASIKQPQTGNRVIFTYLCIACVAVIQTHCNDTVETQKLQF